MLFIFSTGKAQVGINTTNPNSLADFHVENIINGSDTIPKGIMIPRLSVKQRDKMDMTSDTDPNSLMIYNTDEDCYNYYSKTRSEWVSLCGALGKAVITVDCAEVEARGVYSSEVDLETTNFIKISVTVTQPGTYEITGTTNPENGYYFSVSGQFLSSGTYTITVPGFGQPINFTPEGGEGDQIIIKNNGKLLCDDLYIKVVDSSIKPNYSFNCRNIVVQGTYVVGVTLTTDNTIQLILTSDATAKGATYNITTNTVNGYSFSGTGTLTGGQQTITLTSTGTPSVLQTDVFVITSNSTIAGGATCEATVKIAARKITILGAANNDATYNIGLSGNLLNQVMLNANYFGSSQSAVYPVQGFTFQQLNTGSRFAAAISSYNPDIIFAQYNVAGSMNTDDITALASFVDNGGVLIFCTDGETSATGTRNAVAQSLSRAIFDDNTTMTATGAESTTDTKYNTKTIQNTGTMISSGPFMNLSGLSMGRDGGNNFDFTIAGFPYEAGTVVAFSSSDNDAISAFMHKTKGYVFFGDGAPFAAATGNTSPYNWPAKFSTSGTLTLAIPNVYSSPTTYNSFLFLNLMAWAINYVQANR